jgi:4-hydroxythreonine-4-phosphate dehydrogenase
VTRIVITTGEPAGIGPEIALKALSGQLANQRVALIGDAALLQKLAQQHAPTLQLEQMLAGQWPQQGVALWHTPLSRSVVAGQLDPANAPYVLNTLDMGIDMVSRGTAEAMVTCPVAKNVINDAGIAFTGHTEYLAQHTRTAQVVMMLAGGGLRVALATTHLPLKDVAAALNVNSLTKTLQIVHDDLRQKFGIAAPRIAVCGLNPHAGEGGYLGREEIDVINPAIAHAKASGVDARGAYPADTVFQPQVLKEVDCVLAMYHDQGLPTLKYASFGRGVNITLGLPIIRTSVDHGTALDIAGRGVADAGSLLAAIECAQQMAVAARGVQRAA